LQLLKKISFQVHVHANAFSNFPNLLVCLEVEDFDVHDVVNVYKDLSPNFIAFAIDGMLQFLLLMMNLFLLMTYFQNLNFLRWMRKMDNVSRIGHKANKHTKAWPKMH
jgi:hypothetical protein